MPSESFRQRASNCALLTITVICICVLVLCGVMIVREYSLGTVYEPATCKIHNITYARNNLTCTFCEAKDKTKEKGASACTPAILPCIHIDVIYKLKGVHREALLHPDSLQAASPYSQCSYSVCLKFFEQNKKEVERYATRWRKHMAEGSHFPCFYNTESHKTIIVTKNYSGTDVVHGMLWPSLIIIVCGVIFLRLEMKRRGLGFCEQTNIPQQRAPPGGHLPPYDARNGGNVPEVKQTLLHVHNDKEHKIHCSVLKTQGVLSSSMSALDRVKTHGDYKLRVPSHESNYTAIAGKDKPIGSSLSVDGLRLHQVKSLEERAAGDGSATRLLSAIPKDKFRQDSTKTEGGSSTGSQGSKIMGLETPV